jgi:hypothetical protein
MQHHFYSNSTFLGWHSKWLIVFFPMIPHSWSLKMWLGSSDFFFFFHLFSLFSLLKNKYVISFIYFYSIWSFLFVLFLILFWWIFFSFSFFSLIIWLYLIFISNLVLILLIIVYFFNQFSNWILFFHPFTFDFKLFLCQI